KPIVTIAMPTGAPAYATISPAVTLSGWASDEVGVTKVTWSNDRGGSGTAAGTTSWTAGSIALQTGTNVIRVVARDAAGNASTAPLAVSYTPNTPPSVGITTPVPGASIANGATIVFMATAHDAEDGDLAGRVQWSSNLAG